MQSNYFFSHRLSAFVLKSFVQAKPYIFVDDDVIHKTIDWILKNQNDNGTFREPGKVLHKEMQVPYFIRFSSTMCIYLNVQ